MTIRHEDATAMPLPDAAFDAAVGFTKVHHVPSRALQDRLLAEAAQALRLSGIFAGTDSCLSRKFRLLHLCDTMVVMPPETRPIDVQSACFENVRVDLTAPGFAFTRGRRLKPIGKTGGRAGTRTPDPLGVNEVL